MTPESVKQILSKVVVLTRFRIFWVIALFNQTTTSALSTCIAWQLGTPVLPVWIPLLNQVLMLVFSAVGALFARWLSIRRDLGWIIVACTSLQIFTVALMSISQLAYDDSTSRIISLLCISALSYLVAGASGPAWVVLVGNWPGSQRSTSDLIMRESAQFQLANFIGPLVGGGVLIVASRPVALVAVIDAITWAALLGFMLLVRKHPDYDSSPATTQESSRPGSESRVQAAMQDPRLRYLVILAMLAVAVDSPRAYLARIMQEQGAGEIPYSMTMATAALAATIAGMAGAQATSRLHDRQRIGLGLVFAAFGIACWMGASTYTWILGGIGVGVGTALASGAITARLLALAPDRAVGSAALGSIIRRSMSAAGSGMVVLFLAVNGNALAPSLVASLVGISALLSRPHKIAKGDRRRV